MNKKEIFDFIAPKYSIINNTISLLTHKMFRMKAVKKLSGEFNSILDLCCGTGDMIDIYLKKYPKSNIIGIDFSEQMLNIAKKRFNNVTFINHDVQTIPLNDKSVDLCSISFGLRNVDNMSMVLKEISRVLKPNGMFINIDLGKPNRFWNFFLKPYMKYFVPLAGKMIIGNKLPLEYFVHSNEKFPSPDELKKIYSNYGLMQISRKDFLFGQISSQICKKIF
jgi:demethylmenaquinone methyltransferase/2-methoxy-6-polyprenyl-1,4-benzoquinol methylase